MRKIDKVVELMNAKKITIEKLITDLDIPKEKFIAWRNGMEISDEESRKISDYLGVTYDYFYLGIEENTNKSPKISNTSIMSKFSDLAEDNQKPLKKDEYEHKSFLSTLFGFSSNTGKKGSIKGIVTSLIVISIIMAIVLGIFAGSDHENLTTNPFFYICIGIFGLLIIFLIISLIVNLVKKKKK